MVAGSSTLHMDYSNTNDLEELARSGIIRQLTGSLGAVILFQIYDRGVQMASGTCSIQFVHDESLLLGPCPILETEHRFG